jgi:SMI1 / KNR4 family (SUKH-1)
MSAESNLKSIIQELLRLKTYEPSDKYALLIEQDFDDIENRLRVTLPAAYRALHRAVKGVEFKMWDLYRVVPRQQRLALQSMNQPVWGPDDHTLNERKVHGARFPNRLIAIANDGLGNIICFDTLSAIGDEFAVVSWEHDVASAPDFDPSEDIDECLFEIGPTVSDWLVNEIESGEDPR